MINLERLRTMVNSILVTFNQEEQLDILEEECAELIQACSKFKRTGGKVDSEIKRGEIIEEMSHVLISSAVISQIYKISDEEIIAEINKKCDKYGFERI